MHFFNSRSRTPIIIGVFLIAIFILMLPVSCKFKTIERMEETRELMGTYVTVTVFSDNETGTNAINAAFERMEEINDIATIFDKNSEASMLNKNGYLDDPSPEFLELINSSIKYYNLSNGGFDITVQPLLDLWGAGLWEESEEVQAEKINETLEVVGSDKIKVSDKRIEFLKDGMAITLNAIAKGYAVDEAIETIKKFGINQALVNAGGDLYAMGTKSGGEKWTVELDNPDKSGSSDIEPLPTFVFNDKAVATSGNYLRYYDPEAARDYITDTRTGFTAVDCMSVTIIADSCMDADALATSVFVIGPDDGMELVESLGDVESLIIDDEGKIYKSSGLLEYIE